MRYTIAGVAVLLILGLGFYVLRPAEPATDEPLVRDEATTEESTPNPNDATEAAMTDSEATLPTTDAPADGPAVSGMNEDSPVSEEPASSGFADGSYTVETSYFTPRRTEHFMDVTLTLEGGIVTDASIVWDGEAEPKTPNHTSFDEAFEAEVIGQPLEEIYLSRVGGASLTSEAFNEAVQEIESEATAS